MFTTETEVQGVCPAKRTNGNHVVRGGICRNCGMRTEWAAKAFVDAELVMGLSALEGASEGLDGAYGRGMRGDDLMTRVIAWRSAYSTWKVLTAKYDRERVTEKRA